MVACLALYVRFAVFLLWASGSQKITRTGLASRFAPQESPSKASLEKEAVHNWRSSVGASGELADPTSRVYNHSQGRRSTGHHVELQALCLENILGTGALHGLPLSVATSAVGETKEVEIQAQMECRGQEEGQRRDPLSPFGRPSGKAEDGQPWVASSPLLRAPPAKPEQADKTNSAHSQQGKEESTAEQLVLKIQEIPGLTPNAQRAIQQVIATKVAREPSPVRHSHLYRVENLKKALEKLHQRLKEVDAEWEGFVQRVK